jgi:hypothetical protein
MSAPLSWKYEGFEVHLTECYPNSYKVILKGYRESNMPQWYHPTLDEAIAYGEQESGWKNRSK